MRQYWKSIIDPRRRTGRPSEWPGDVITVARSPLTIAHFANDALHTHTALGGGVKIGMASMLLLAGSCKNPNYGCVGMKLL